MISGVINISLFLFKIMQAQLIPNDHEIDNILKKIQLTFHK